MQVAAPGDVGHPWNRGGWSRVATTGAAPSGRGSGEWRGETTTAHMGADDFVSADLYGDTEPQECQEGLYAVNEMGVTPETGSAGHRPDRGLRATDLANGLPRPC